MTHEVLSGSGGPSASLGVLKNIIAGINKTLNRKP
jgi:hypothetical protein